MVLSTAPEQSWRLAQYGFINGSRAKLEIGTADVSLIGFQQLRF